MRHYCNLFSFGNQMVYVFVQLWVSVNLSLVMFVPIVYSFAFFEDFEFQQISIAVVFTDVFHGTLFTSILLQSFPAQMSTVSPNECETSNSAGAEVVFDKSEEANSWSGIYQLKPYPIYDSAKRLRSFSLCWATGIYEVGKGNQRHRAGKRRKYFQTTTP